MDTTYYRDRMTGMKGATMNDFDPTDYSGTIDGEHYDGWAIVEMYDDALNDGWGDVILAGITHATSDVLRVVDPVAYRCGLVDWLDAICWVED